jgi:hypothetical protein
LVLHQHLPARRLQWVPQVVLLHRRTGQEQENLHPVKA